MQKKEKIIVAEDEKLILYEQYQVIWLESKANGHTETIVDLNIENQVKREWDSKTNHWIDEPKVDGKISTIEVYDGLLLLRKLGCSKTFTGNYVDHCAKREQEIEDSWAFAQIFKTKTNQEL